MHLSNLNARHRYTAPEGADPNRIGTDEDALTCRKARERGKPNRLPTYLGMQAGKPQGDL